MTGRVGLTVVAVLLAAACGCGTGEVNVTGTSYAQKLVLEGWIMPGYLVSKIHVSRNFPLDADLRSAPTDYLVPADATARLIHEGTGRTYPLTLRRSPRYDDTYFEYVGDDLSIEYGEEYTLDVSGTVDGRQLHAWCTARVPEAGFRVVAVNHARLPYRPLDEEGQPVDFELEIERAPGTPFYLFTLRPLLASSANFVYDNPFHDTSPSAIAAEIDEYNFEYGWVQNTPLTPGRSTIRTFWYMLWFYSRYEVVVYAADANYRQFLQTYDQVQEHDGNFHAPRFQVQGDGIGVFGAVVPDTVYVEVARNG